MEELHESRKAAMTAALGLLSKGMIPAPTLAQLQELIEKAAEEHGTTVAAMEFMELAEDSTLASPFVDHMAVYGELDKAYDAIYSEKKVNRKLAYKKYHAVAEDKKADPALLADVTANKDEVDRELAKLGVKIVQVKLVLGPSIAERLKEMEAGAAPAAETKP